jgi:hypothetical protein
VSKKKELEKECIKKFFFEKYKYIAQCGGKKIKELGLEAALEACEALFKDGSLTLKAFNKNEFFVFLYHKNKKKYELLYDSKKILTD